MTGNANFNQISQFVFGLFGSFSSSEAGWTTTKQKAFCKEPEAAFGRYCLFDENSQLCCLENSFINQVCSFVSEEKKKELVHSINIWLAYPRFLAFSIKKYPVFFEGENTNFIYWGLPFFLTFMVNRNVDVRKVAHITYSNIQKESGIPNLKKISESATWKTLKEIFENLEENPAKDKFVFDCVNHFLYLNFNSSLQKVFNMKPSHIDKIMAPKIGNLENEKINSFNDIFACIIQIKKQWYFENDAIFNSAIFTYANKILNPSGPEVIKEIESFTNCVQKYSDKTFIEVYSLWFKNRGLIFNLDFSNEDEVRATGKIVRENFKKAFEKGKYIFGDSLKEFLIDAITVDVYFDSIETKTIIENTQDFRIESKRSSINMPGKSYWEFAYALGILNENSQKTYLTAFNAGKNFWSFYPVYCFKYRESALQKFKKEAFCTEHILIQNVHDFCKTDRLNKLLDFKSRESFRINLNGRMYNVLSIAVMNHEDKFIHTASKNFIREMDAEILCLNDECGASPLIRALYEYKMLVYGFNKEDRILRSKLYSEACEAKKNLYSIYQAPSSEDFDDKYYKIELDLNGNIFQTFPLEYISPGKPSAFRTPQILKLMSDLKKDIIIPLIEKIGNSKYASSLLDEAIEIDSMHCVSALQLAIDCFDFELVELLIKNIPEKDLSNIFISEEFVTPLQYAVRKYDFLMQSYDYYEKLFFDGKKNIGPINKVNIQSRRKNISGGFSEEDDLILKKRNHFLLANLNPIEECGRNFIQRFSNEDEREISLDKNLVYTNQFNLYQIITSLLLAATSKISVQTFYFIADMTESYYQFYDDILQMTKALINSGKANLGGTNFDYTDAGSLPEETLTAHCLRDRKYFFLDFLLQTYPEKFTGILNTLIYGTDENSYFRIETDLHMFLLNMIESVNACNEMNSQDRKENYKMQINFTLKKMLPSFKKAGARFDIQNQDCVTAQDLLEELSRLGEGWLVIPEL